MNRNEKVYKTMIFSGVTGIVTGAVVMVIGIAAGILMVISGIKLIKDKKGLTI